MKNNLKILGLLAGATAMLPIAAGAQQKAARAPKKQPNVLFIMCDQHNARALGCYGDPVIQTPNMDRIAKNGVIFTHGYCTTAQSVPSRYSIWTGLYSRTTGTYSNGQSQNSDIKTVAELFKPAGYITATIGKHHMEMTKENNNHGWDYVWDRNGGLTSNNPLPREEVNPGRSPVGPSPEPNETHSAGIVASETIKFIDANKDKPFVVWCSFIGPHTPITPSEPWASMYKPEEMNLPPNLHVYDKAIPGITNFIDKSGKFSTDYYHQACMAYYYGYVSQIDYNIGRVLDELDKLGLTDNTIIVYTADHGEMLSEHTMWTKGGTGYEATHRVPYIIRYPGIFDGGKQRDEIVCSIDFLPTFLDVAGIAIPSNLQGHSLVPLVQGKAKQWREYTFTQGGDDALNGTLAVTGKEWKYVRYMTGGKIVHEQLFDRINDPWEMKNLAGDKSYETQLNRMRGIMQDWEKSTPTMAACPLLAGGDSEAAAPAEKRAEKPAGGKAETRTKPKRAAE